MYSIKYEMYKSSEIKDVFTSANVVKASRFLLSLENPAFEKQSVLQANKLRAVLKHTLLEYLKPPCSSLSRLSWILQLEQEITILLRLVKNLYPLLTVSARNQLITHLQGSSEFSKRKMKDTTLKQSCIITRGKSFPAF